MDVREKLVELLDDIQVRGEDFTDYEIYGMRVPDTISNEDVALHLIAHGVTVQEWKPISEPPKEKGTYLVCTDNGGVLLGHLVWNGLECRRGSKEAPCVLDGKAPTAERRMIMAKNVVCKKCNNLVNSWCEKVLDSPDPDMTRDCRHFWEKTNADRIRAMSDEEMADYFAYYEHNIETNVFTSLDPIAWLEWLKQPAEE